MPTVMFCTEFAHKQPGPHIDVLHEAGFEVTFPDDPTFTRGNVSSEEVVRVLGDVEAIVSGGEYLTENVIGQLPRLRVVARAGVGYDRVDIAAATAHDIVVTITPHANHEAVAEHAVALLFAISKSTISGDRNVRAGLWPQTATRPLRKSTFGLLGLGRIGRSTAKRVSTLGMNLLATEPFPDENFVRQYNIEIVDLDTLLTHSDFLSLHCPLNENTAGMFDSKMISKMKPGSVLINTARGKIVHDAAVVDAVKSGHLAGAGLDVFEDEPPRKDHPLFGLDNVVLSPHIASTDEISRVRMSVDAAECITALYRGEWPEGCVVNETLHSEWKW